VIWDVISASVTARLDDVAAAQELLDSYSAATKGDCAVQGLAWVLPCLGVLAVVVAPALLLIWDTKSGCGHSLSHVLGFWLVVYA